MSKSLNKPLLSILPTLILLSMITYGQTTVSYIESTTDFPNPERGFYRHTETHASSYTALNAATLEGYRSSHTPSSASYSIYSSLILRVFYLDSFVSSSISSTFLTNMQNDFDAIRTAGMKVIVRFAYTKAVDGSSCANWICPPYGDATKAQVLSHITQLQPYLQSNSDVIAAIQMGFIGTWGEQYYTDNFGDAYTQGYWTTANWDDRIEVLNALLTAVPASRMIQVRIPQMKQRTVYGSTVATTSAAITENEAHKGTTISRLGFHNDCFLASYTDFGTYNDMGYGPPTVSASADTTNLKPYKASDSKYTVVGGETCSEYTPFDNCGAGGGIAETELFRFHYSYLNADYNNNVNNGWVGTCMDSIRNKLGYRLVLRNGTYSDEAQPNQVIDVTLNLKNIGFAAPYNQRGVELVLRNASDGTKYYATLTDDPRFWLHGHQKINHTLCIPSTMPTGTYNLLLNLPDPASTLYTDPDYSIQLANTGVWESSTGYNDLNHTVAINGTASNAACASEITFQSSSSFLPVELISFNANITDAAVLCHWSTASETNNDGFWLQRSNDGIHFENLVWIEGQGTISRISHYEFEDKNVKPNVSYYYRLKQLDYNGVFNYSKIIQAILKKSYSNHITVSPNPTQKDVFITFEQSFTGTLTIVDVMGKVIQSRMITEATQFQLNIEDLTNGLYFVILDDDFENQVFKVVKL